MGLSPVLASNTVVCECFQQVADYCQNTYIPATHMKGQDRIPSLALAWIGATVAAFWGLDQQMEEIANLLISPHTLSYKKKNQSLKIISS